MSGVRARVASAAVLALALLGLTALPALAATPTAEDFTQIFHKNAPDIIYFDDHASDVDGGALQFMISVDTPPHGTLNDCPVGVWFSGGECSYTPAVDSVDDESINWNVRDPQGNVSPIGHLVIDLVASGSPEVQHLQVTAAPGSKAALTWDNPPNTTGVVVRRGSGFSFPATPTDGTAVTVGAGNDNALTGVLAAGSYAFSVFATTAKGTSTPTVAFYTQATNQNPVAVADSASTPQDTAKVVDVLANDTDADGPQSALSVVPKPVTATPHGSVTCSAANCTYTPNGTDVGQDTFTYTVTDALGGVSAPGTVTITVTAVVPPQPPNATDDAMTVAEDSGTSAAKAVLVNDTDANGDTLTITAKTNGTHGTAACGTTTCTYTPDANFNGTDSFTYTISDGHAGTDTATVNVTVTAVNDAPVAVDDTISTNEDTQAAKNLVANDTDVDADTLTISPAVCPPTGPCVFRPSHGTVSCSTTTCTYTPTANYNGTDAFSYTVTDGHGGTSTGTVTVTVVSVNDAPNAVDDSVTTAKNAASAPASVLVNDTDADGDTLTVTGKTNGTHGTVTCTTTTCTYTPATDFTGPDAFTYTISDGHGGTDTATVNVTVNPPSYSDVKITMTRFAAVVPVGDSTGYTLVVQNTGNTTSPAVSLSDVLPTGFKFQNVSASSLAPCSAPAGTVSCSLGGVAPNGTVTVVIRGAFTKSGAIGNTASITAAGDPTPADNTSSVTTTADGQSCTIIGSFGNDTLTGTSGTNVICGLAGNDTLKALQGNDVLYGNDGNDHLNGYTGGDTVDGGPGIDTAEFSSLAAGVTVDLTAGTGSGQGADVLVSIENVTGSSGNDVLVGNSLANLLSGLGGNDSLTGLDGNDRLLGGAGTDRLIGGNGNDYLDGGTGADNCAQGTGTGSKISC